VKCTPLFKYLNMPLMLVVSWCYADNVVITHQLEAPVVADASQSCSSTAIKTSDNSGSELPPAEVLPSACPTHSTACAEDEVISLGISDPYMSIFIMQSLTI